MPFIGKQPQAGAYSKLDAITTSATATYNLTLDSGAYSPQSANHLLVSLNGVIQAPQDSFTVSGSQIIFDSALTSSDVIDFIIALGDTLDIGVPSAGSVNTSQLANDAVTAAKIAAGVVNTTELASNAVTTAKIADDAITGAKIENNPTIAGNLAVTGTSALTGNVGIGTAAGGNPLAVQADSGAGGIDILGRSSDNTATMVIGKSADGNTMYNTITSYSNRMRIQSGFSGDSNSIEFYTNDGLSMNIDSAGRVTAAGTPYFRVQKTNGSLTSAQIIIWNTVIQNVGSHYNSSNGRFTAPVNGVYQFNVLGSITSSPTDTSLHRVRINGTFQSDLFPIATNDASHISYCLAFALKLSANDYVDIESGSSTWYGTGNYHNGYTGYLVG